MMKKLSYQTVDEYIALFSPPVRDLLEQMRKVIRETVPEAVEVIAYQMLGYKLNGKPLVYFAACKNHIGFYPTPEPLKMFAKEVSKYRFSKGAVQFSFDEPIPFNLVQKMVLWRVKQLSPQEDLLSILSSPARRALENAKIYTLEHLAEYTEKEILEFHGMGKSSLPKLRQALNSKELSFAKASL